MMNDRHFLDDFFKQNLAQHEAPFEEGAWDKIAQRLDENPSLHHSVDTWVRKKLSGYEAPYQEQYWHGIRRQLEYQNYRRWAQRAAVAALLLLGLKIGFTYQNTIYQEQNIGTSSAPSSVTPHNNGNNTASDNIATKQDNATTANLPATAAQSFEKTETATRQVPPVLNEAADSEMSLLQPAASESISSLSPSGFQHTIEENTTTASPSSPEKNTHTEESIASSFGSSSAAAVSEMTTTAATASEAINTVAVLAEIPPLFSALPLTTIPLTATLSPLQKPELPPRRAASKWEVGADLGLLGNWSAPKTAVREQKKGGGLSHDEIRYGTTAGMSVCYQLTTSWSLQSGLYYTEKNYYFENVNTPHYLNGEVKSLRINYNSLEIPFLVRYNFGKNRYFQPEMAAGVALFSPFRSLYHYAVQPFSYDPSEFDNNMPLLLQEDGVSIEYYALQNTENLSDNRTYIEKPEKFISNSSLWACLELRAGIDSHLSERMRLRGELVGKRSLTQVPFDASVRKTNLTAQATDASIGINDKEVYSLGVQFSLLYRL
ncbi:MAG: PorT family protein [Sphingobacteriales bacterium]|nr:PorT family protein [Sphingobacteriales bacterium]